MVAAFVLSCTWVLAQEPVHPPHPPRPEERMRHTKEMLQRELNLNATQMAKVEAAFATFFEGADKIRKENPPPPPPPIDPKVKASLDKLEKERDASIKSVLTVEQYEKYKKAAERMRPPAPDRPKPVKE